MKRTTKKEPAKQTDKKKAEKKPWPKCSTPKCGKDSVVLRRVDGEEVHYCARHHALDQDERRESAAKKIRKMNRKVKSDA